MTEPIADTLPVPDRSPFDTGALQRYLRPGMQADERGALYDDINRVVAALHRVDPASVGLADYGRTGDYLARQIARWSKQFAASVTQPLEAMDRLIAWLPSRIPGDETTS